MSPRRNGAWTKTKSEETLEGLRETYPGYTDNELYAIWCRDHGLIPLDANEKLNLDQWRIHAGQDGQHVSSEGFKISRAIYGRALKAQKGVSKPRHTRRKKAEIMAEREAAAAPTFTGLSPRALELARSYDRASAVLTEALAMRREILDLMRTLSDIDRCVILDLADQDSASHELLTQAGLLRAQPSFEESLEEEERYV